MWISSIHTKRWRNRMWWWTISGSCPCACERSIKHAVQTARHATVLWTWYPTIRHTVSGGFSLLLMTPKSDKVDTGRQLSVNKSYQHCHDWLVSTKYFQKTVMFVPIEIENMYPGVWRRFPFILIYKGCWISPHISTTGSLPEHHLCLSTFQYKGNVYRHTCAFFKIFVSLMMAFFTCIDTWESTLQSHLNCFIYNPLWQRIEANLQKLCHCPKTYGPYCTLWW